MKIKHLLPFVFGALVILSACKKKEEPAPDVLGCKDPDALNYDASVTVDNGSCVYPDVYVPVKNGNSWTLKDEVFIVLENVEITASFEMYKDTTIGDQSYVLQREKISAASSLYTGDLSEEIYAYRWEKSGKVYRIKISPNDVPGETLFLDYPLSLNHEWYDNDAQDNLHCRVVSNALINVPAGDFEAFGVTYTRMSDSIATTVYFGKEVGLARFDISMDILGTEIDIKAELESYTLN